MYILLLEQNDWNAKNNTVRRNRCTNYVSRLFWSLDKFFITSVFI